MLIDLNGRQLTPARMQNGFYPSFIQEGAYEPNVFRNVTALACMAAITNEIVKLRPVHVKRGEYEETAVNADIQHVLDYPNEMETYHDFMHKAMYMLFVNNNVYIAPKWENNRLKALYILTPTNVTFLRDPAGRMGLKLEFGNGYSQIVPYQSLIHLRWNFGANEFLGGGQDGTADYETLCKAMGFNKQIDELLKSALSSSQRVVGILKYKTMLSDQKMKDGFQELVDRLNSSNSGILTTDISADYQPVERRPIVLDPQIVKMLNQRVLQYFGVPENILDGSANNTQRNAFYNSCIAPFAVMIGDAFSKGLFSDRERAGYGNRIYLEPDILEWSSISERIEISDQLGNAGLLLDNERRRLFGFKALPELEGRRTISLNYIDATVGEQYRLIKAGADPEQAEAYIKNYHAQQQASLEQGSKQNTTDKKGVESNGG